MKRILLSAALFVAVLVPAGGVQAAPPQPVNLAYGAETSQSSTYQGGLAARAVDGNEHGVFAHGSVTHTNRDTGAWWEVDLGEVAEITEVVVWNRTDSSSGRLANFHVLVSDVPFTSTALAATRAQAGVGDYHHPGTAGTETRVAVGRSGRYVRVQLEGRNYLHLAEVEVLSYLGEEGQPAASAAELDVDVFVDGLDAFEAPGPVVGPDGDALFTYQVRNLGGQTLYGLYLWQDRVGEVPCPATKLYAGELVVCEITVPVSPGEHAASVSAEAWTASGDRVGDAPAVHYRVEGGGPPGLENLALGKAARQTEDRGSPSAHPARLAVDGDLGGDLRNGSVSMTYRIVEAYWEVDLGAVYDIDSITLWNRTDCCSDRLRDFHVFVSDEPFGLDDLQYTMTQPGVLDVHHRGTADRRADVGVGRTGRYVRIQAAYREAIIALAEVQVWGTPAAAPAPTGPESPPAATTLDVQVSVGGDDADAAPGPVLVPGDPVAFTYEVTNTGTEFLWAIFLWDDEFRRVDTCPTNRLAPGETLTCVVEAVAEAGQFGTRVEATGWDAAGIQAIDYDSAYYLGTADGTVVGAALDLEAFVEGIDADAAPGFETAPGEALSFTYEVTNTGTERLWALNLWHSGVGAADCPQTMLEVGASVTCTGVGRADAGQVVADVYANAWDAAGNRASDSDPVAHLGVTDVAGPSIVVESRVDGQDADDPPGATVLSGRAAEFTYQVKNTGSRTLWGLWVWDREHGEATCPARSLAPGETITCRLTATPADGLHEDAVYVEAWDAEGNRVEDTDLHHYFVARQGAAVDLEALVDGLNGWWRYGPRIRLGEVVTRSFVVANVGSVPLTDIRVSDDLVGEVTCPRTSLQPGETLTCAVTQYTQLGKAQTVAHVTAQAGSATVSADEPLDWHVKVTSRNLDISMSITVDGQPTAYEQGPDLRVGGTALVRYEVFNLGTWTSIFDVQIRDPRVPMSQMSCTNTREVYLGSVVCTARIPVTEGFTRQLVVADAWSANTPKMQASGWVTWTGVP